MCTLVNLRFSTLLLVVSTWQICYKLGNPTFERSCSFLNYWECWMYICACFRKKTGLCIILKEQYLNKVNSKVKVLKLCLKCSWENSSLQSHWFLMKLACLVLKRVQASVDYNPNPTFQQPILSKQIDI
jgi:hypothetical protein